MSWLKQNWLKVSILTIVIIAGFSIGTAVVLAHPGRTDASGCHTCRTNCPSWGLSFGEYHCHRAKALPQPKPPIKSKFGEGGTGYTQPAPEYANPSVSAPKNIDNPKTITSQSTQPPQPKKGFWQSLFGLFK